MKKAIFFDVDGTLTTTKSGATFKQNSEDIKLNEGIEKGIISYKDWILIGVSNQGGCSAIDKNTGKPFKTIDSTVEEMRNTLKLIPQLKSIYFCPDFKGYYCYKVTHEKSEAEKYDNSQEAVLVPYANYDSSVDGFQYELSAEENFRKPGYGMITLGINEYRLHDALEIWMVGDREEDENAAKNAHINFIYADAWRSRFI